MIRQRLLSIFNLKVKELNVIQNVDKDNNDCNFPYGIQETWTGSDHSWLMQYGVITEYNSIYPGSISFDGDIYYQLVGRGGNGYGRENSVTISFKTWSNNQNVQFSFKTGSGDTNDFLGVCSLDSTDKNSLVVKLSGGSSQDYTFTVGTAGSHFVKIYYYQHTDSNASANENWGAFRLTPFSNSYEYGYRAPEPQETYVKSYYGWYISNIPAWTKVEAYSRDVYDGNWDGIHLNKINLTPANEQPKIVKPGKRPIFVSVLGNPGDHRQGTISILSRLNNAISKNNGSLNVCQGANPHPNEIYLSVEKVEFPNKPTRYDSNVTPEGRTYISNYVQPAHYVYQCYSDITYNYKATIKVELIGNANGYTISGVPNGFTVKHPQSCPSDFSTLEVIKNSNDSGTSPASFTITGTACAEDTDSSLIMSKSVTIGQESVQCYCDCNRYDGCGCEIWDHFERQDLNTADGDWEELKFTKEQLNTNCDSHCESYDVATYPICSSHSICQCDCEYHNGCSCDTQCQPEVNPCSNYGYDCSCDGTYTGCGSDGYVSAVTSDFSSSCGCHGTYTGCGSDGYSSSCGCHGTYTGCGSDGYSSSCGCHGTYTGCGSDGYSSSCTCHGTYTGCGSDGYSSSCTCHGTYTGCGSYGYVPAGCGCHGNYNDCPNYLADAGSCACFNLYDGCSSYISSSHMTCGCNRCNQYTYTCRGEVQRTGQTCSATCLDLINQGGGIWWTSPYKTCLTNSRPAGWSCSGADTITVNGEQLPACNVHCYCDCALFIKGVYNEGGCYGDSANRFESCPSHSCGGYQCNCNNTNEWNTESCLAYYPCVIDKNDTEVSSCECHNTYSNAGKHIIIEGTCHCDNAYGCDQHNITECNCHGSYSCSLHSNTCDCDHTYSCACYGGYFLELQRERCNLWCSADDLYLGGYGVVCTAQEYCPQYDWSGLTNDCDEDTYSHLNNTSCPVYLISVCHANSGEFGDSEQIPINWCAGECKNDTCPTNSGVTCTCHNVYDTCLEYSHNICICHGTYDNCQLYQYKTIPIQTDSSCSCNGQYECSSYAYTSSCSCDGSYSCTSYIYTSSCSCNSAYECTTYAYTSSCSCNSAYECTTYAYTSSCSCDGSYSCEPYGYTSSCTVNESSESSCSCNGNHSCSGHVSDCSCHGVVCNDVPITVLCSKYNCTTDVNTCQCNLKTYYPYCNCHSVCITDNYTAPSVE